MDSFQKKKLESHKYDDLQLLVEKFKVHYLNAPLKLTIPWYLVPWNVAKELCNAKCSCSTLTPFFNSCINQSKRSRDLCKLVCWTFSPVCLTLFNFLASSSSSSSSSVYDNKKGISVPGDVQALSVKILVFPSPTGYMLRSFRFSLFISLRYISLKWWVALNFNWLFLKLNRFVCN